MRGLFSLIGLLVVLAIVGLVAKQQLGAAGAHKAAQSSSSPVSDAVGGISPQVATPQQRQQLQQQVQDDLNKVMQNRSADLDQQAEPKP